jgi:hypothetical protein
MRIEHRFTDLVLTSHAGLAALAHVLKAARLPALFGASLKTIPDTTVFTTQIALLVLGETDLEAVSAYRNDPAFRRLLRLTRVPPVEILRHCLPSRLRTVM